MSTDDMDSEMSKSFTAACLDQTRYHDISLTFHVMRLATLWRTHLDRVLRPNGLTLATMRPMAYLMISKTPLTQSDLASLIGVDRSALVRLLDVLEAEGLVIRQTDTQDRRLKMVLLTAEGKKQCRLFHRLAADLEAELTTGLSMSQKLTLTKDLDMMEALLSADHGVSA
ncbi:MarR family winged helix-turn-helix transcriptional regulator [Gluconobacter cerinus]|uniref:MarR family winged helix-turn-helix transcriptional regulator n=1 Tax=Gluconobacter cerinus TaxID=38307 RepID=UPI001B8B6CD7|nr:MarR family transcriptional regulator [Gluconobacter cerinus]